MIPVAQISEALSGGKPSIIYGAVYGLYTMEF